MNDDSGKSNKYRYRQFYRQAWEELPEFKGWLTNVPGQPNQAFCKYCRKNLHAHRLSLLKHTCTLKHERATAAMKRNANENISDNCENLDANEESTKITINSSNEEINEYIEESFVDEKYQEHVIVTVDESFNKIDSNQQEQPTEKNVTIEALSENQNINEVDVYDDEEIATFIEKQNSDNSAATISIIHPRIMSAPIKPPISTHILDTSRGRPAIGVPVTLYQQLSSDIWSLVAQGSTNVDGRCADFLKKDNFTVGVYKLHFDVGKYFTDLNVKTLYPYIEVSFTCDNANEHYHIPLLLNPFGYSTYRGT